MSLEQRLTTLKLQLPQPSQAMGNYQAWRRTGNLIFVSGQFPIMNGVLKYSGKLGADLTELEGYEAAKLAALNVLAQLNQAIKKPEKLYSIVRLDGHIQCSSDWNNHAKVLDGASDLFAEVLGTDIGHVRTAFGQTTLPLNAPIELVAIADLKNC